MFLLMKHKYEGEKFRELLQETLDLIEEEMLSFRKDCITTTREKNLKTIKNVFKEEDYSKMLSTHILNKVLFELIKDNGSDVLN